jgi:hypothetical protein
MEVILSMSECSWWSTPNITNRFDVVFVICRIRNSQPIETIILKAFDPRLTVIESMRDMNVKEEKLSPVTPTKEIFDERQKSIILLDLWDL